jgi:WD40 repeat protein
MTNPTVGVDVSGGQIQGIVGAGSVVIENLTFYSRAPEEPAPTAGAEPIGPCPYPGLAYFGPSDADLFFGRDAAITRLADAVGRQSFTALVGASGSGKSSVVLAGLAPHLNATAQWRFSHFRIGNEPGGDPFLAVARALAPLYVTSDSDTERLRNTKLLATSLQAGELTLANVFADCRSRNKGSRILLIADQFEEAFTLVADEAVRHRFIDMLLAGFPNPAPGSLPDICLIMTLRADFYGVALRHRPLADALQSHVENLGPMNREELQAAISRPAENAKVSFESGLVETLLDVASKPGSLPLLQFALREMWGRQEKRKITRKSYDEIGGVEGALAQRAELIFAALTENGANVQMEKSFQRLFSRLVTLGEGQEDTRRVVEHRELGDVDWSLAQRLAGEDNRLVVTNAPTGSHETAEVVHEALIRHWPRLVDWINRDRAFQSWLRQIKSNVEQWSADPTDEGTFLRGGMLAQATDWFARRRDDLSPAEGGYIEASIAASEARQRQARRAVMLTRVAAGILLMLFVASSFFAVGLIGASNEADERLQAANAAARESAQQTARAQGAVARLENDGTRFFEAASAALAGLTVPLMVDQDHPDQIRPWLELERAAADRFLVPPLQHGGAVSTVAFDPTGERVVTASGDHTARIWDARTGEPIGKPMKHEGTVQTAAFDPKGERVVTASDDKTARIWDARTGLPIGKPMQHDVAVWTTAFDPTGDRVVTAAGNTARIWDARTGALIGKPMQHKDKETVMTVAFDPKGERVVTASTDHTARIWDARTGLPIGKPMQHDDKVLGAAFDPTGERVVTAAGNVARIWNARTGALIGKPMQHNGGVLAAAFDPKGERIVTASNDNNARVWDARTGALIGVPMEHKDLVIRAAFDRTGERVVTASYDNTARIWDARTGWPIGKPLQHLGRVNAAAFDPKSERVVTASDDKTARIWDARTGESVGKPMEHKDTVNTAAFDPKGERVVTASDDTTARLWDARTGEPIGKPMQHKGAVATAAFDPTGERVVTASTDKTARLWDARTGDPIGKPMQHEGAVSTAAFDPKGGRVVTASEDKTARLWDARTGDPVGKPMQHNGTVLTAAFDPTGERVVTASEDKTARIWDARTGDPIGKPMQHEDAVLAAAFDPKGERVVTASKDRTARLWDARTGEPIGKPMQHLDSVNGVAFDPKGERVVTVSDDATARIWDARTGEPMGKPMDHEDAVFTAVFDPKGERVVAASKWGARLWDARTDGSAREPMQQMEGTNTVLTAAFDPNGERVITAAGNSATGAGNSARIWNVPPTGQILVDQVRARLGRNAPEPLKIASMAEGRHGSVGAIATGFGVIWARMTAAVSFQH